MCKQIDNVVFLIFVFVGFVIICWMIRELFHLTAYTGYIEEITSDGIKKKYNPFADELDGDQRFAKFVREQNLFEKIRYFMKEFSNS